MPRVVDSTSKTKSPAAAANAGSSGRKKAPPPSLPSSSPLNKQTVAAASPQKTTEAAAAGATVSTTTEAKKKSTHPVQRSLKFTIEFKSDLNKSTRATWPCGVLHAAIVSSPSSTSAGGAAAATAIVTATSGGEKAKEEHCFVWISNLNHINKALDHLKKFGFYSDDEAGDTSTTGSCSSVAFIPYSSRSNWCYKYPMAFPNIHVDLDGNVCGYPYWNPELGQQVPFANASVAIIGGAATNTVGALFGSVHSALPPAAFLPPALPPLPAGVNIDKLSPSASLSNEARSQLHCQIYTYFSWLKTQLMMNQTAGGSGMMMGDVDNMTLFNGIGNILNIMESAFGESVTTNTNNSALIAGSGGTSNTPKKRRAISATSKAMMSTSEDAMQPPPLLEYGLVEQLNQLVAAEKNSTVANLLSQHDDDDDDQASSSPKRRKTQKSGDGVRGNRTSGNGSGGNAPLDFDDMYQRLVTFKAEHGHVNVPQGYKDDKQLGSWVTNIRYKRKCLQKSGLEFEVEEEEEGNDHLMLGGVEPMNDFEATANILGMDLGTSTKKDGVSGGGSTKLKRKKKRLSQERIAQLDNLGFLWSQDKQYKSWDERFNELQEYKRVNGNTRVPRASGSLGEWVHMQRKMYHKNDKNFMARRAPRLEAIGFEWRTRNYDLVSWEENFLKLVKFGTENQHYHVPGPMEDIILGDGGDSNGQEEANRFYKWVKRTRAEYKSLMGGKTSKMLTEDRVAKLRQIGFIV